MNKICFVRVITRNISGTGKLWTLKPKTAGLSILIKPEGYLQHKIEIKVLFRKWSKAAQTLKKTIYNMTIILVFLSFKARVDKGIIRWSVSIPSCFVLCVFRSYSRWMCEMPAEPFSPDGRQSPVWLCCVPRHYSCSAGLTRWDTFYFCFHCLRSDFPPNGRSYEFSLVILQIRAEGCISRRRNVKYLYLITEQSPPADRMGRLFLCAMFHLPAAQH